MGAPTADVDADTAAAATRSAGELGQIGVNGLRPAAVAVALLFTFFAIHNAVTYGAWVRATLVAYDVALVAVGGALFVALGHATWSLAAVHRTAALLSFAVLGNILAAALFGVSDEFTLYVVILIVASAGSVLSTSWAITIALVEVIAWSLAAASVLPADRVEPNALVVLSSLAAAGIVHAGRVRARSRIMELRGGDALRELALQRALDEADAARRELDGKVLERTDALRGELEQRLRLEEQLRHAQKLDALGRLAGGIAHDFNNLLTVIRMSLGTIEEPGMTAAEQTDAMRDAQDATDRAAHLTHDLLAFARKQKLERKPVSVVELVQRVERMVRRLIDASISFEVAIAEPVGEILADAHQIEQVVLNLAINACDAMHDRGALALSVGAVDVDAAEAARHGLSPGTYVRIAVRDTGSGMDEATIRSVFEPFFTTKEVGRGTGLGLSVAHGIVTQHGGQIGVVSAVGVGSTFTVWLPKAVAGSQALRPSAAKMPRAALGETLLLVEDEPAVRRAVQRSLERLGYHVVSAQDGEHALALVDSLDRFDLLVSDVVMPGIAGPELARQLRERWPNLPVLYLTGYSRDRFASDDSVRATDRILEKPYVPEELASTIRQMLTRASPGD